jgi:hypothetical protein
LEQELTDMRELLEKVGAKSIMLVILSTIGLHESKPINQSEPQPQGAPIKLAPSSSRNPLPPRTRRVFIPSPLLDGHRNTGIGTPSNKPWFIWMVIPAILLVLSLAGVALRNTFVPKVAYSATVTITPLRKDQEKIYVIMGVIGLSDASRREVEARFLFNTSISKPILVSGVGHIPATIATGNLTLYNSLPYTQTIVSGTVFTDKSGVQVVNDQSFIIPAARPPTEGSVTVLAHSVIPGTKGNISAFAFNDVPCCMAGITVQNRAAFKGGRNQRAYPYVQQSDIDGAVNSEKASLLQQAESMLNAELFQNEQFVNHADTCTSNSNSDHAARDKVTSIAISVSVTCTNEAFDQQGAELLARNLLVAQSIHDLGPGFALIGKVLTRITKIVLLKAYHDAIMLCVSARSIWAYQFSDRTKQLLAARIAGKRSTQAQSILMHQFGVSLADIQIKGKHTEILPSDPEHITVVFQNVHGL